MTAWAGGSFGERARCVLAPNPGMMTLDGTNTWVLREPGARRSVVVDPGPLGDGHLEALLEAAGEVGVVLLTHAHLDHSEGAAAFAERVGCGVRALDRFKAAPLEILWYYKTLAGMVEERLGGPMAADLVRAVDDLTHAMERAVPEINA